MPNRIIRESLLESEPVNSLSIQAENFFFRLMLKADDFGRFTAHKLLLKSALYPLRPDVRESDISRCLAECKKAGVIALYQVSGKDYLVILKFDQRMRAAVSKFPAPAGNCQSSGSQAAAAGLPPALGGGDGGECGDVGQSPAADEPPPASSPPSKKAPELTDEEYISELSGDPAFTGLNVPQEAAKMRRWCRANGKQPTRRRLVNWLNRADRPMSANGNQPTQLNYIP